MLINGKEYEINRENAVVRQWDKVYCELLKKILSEGEIFHNRTGIDTLSIEGVSFKLDVAKEFPILETKKVAVHNALSEMLWIHQAQSNDVSWLHKRNNHIWDEWRIDEDGIYRIYDNADSLYDETKEVVVKDLDGNVKLDDTGSPIKAKSLNGKNIKEAKFFGKEFAGTIGTAYGWINNKFKRPQYVLRQLKENPHDRRMNISLWQDEYLKTAVLPSCVWSVEFKVMNGKLHAFVHQRSCDTPLGLPFNVSQYAMLLAMFAKVSGLEVGNLNWSIMDAHIYVNQIEGVKKQLDRYEKMLAWERAIERCSDSFIEERLKELRKIVTSLEVTGKEDLLDYKEDLMLLELMLTKEKPTLELADKDDFFGFSSEINNDREYLKENLTGNEDIKVLKYKSAPFIKFPIAQ